MATQTLPPPFAVIIEPQTTLADTTANALRNRDFELLVTWIHAGGAQAPLDYAVVDFLIANVPPPGEDRTGAHLIGPSELNPDLKTVFMLADLWKAALNALAGAVRLVKPFERAQHGDAMAKAPAVRF